MIASGNSAPPPEGKAMAQPATQKMLKFGPYLVDLAAGEIRKNSTKIRLQEKPLRVLGLLADKQGQVVTREELKKRLWPEDTFVDFETGLNTAVCKLRDCLSDNAGKPRYIETIPRRGYRFLALVETIEQKGAATNLKAKGVQAEIQESKTENLSAAVTDIEKDRKSTEFDETKRVTPEAGRKRWPWQIVAIVGTVVVALSIACYALYKSYRANSLRPTVSIAVLPFMNLTGDASKDYLCDGLTEEMITSLARTEEGQLRVIARTSAMSYKATNKPVKQIAQELGVQYVLEGSVQSEGNRLHVTSQLIRGDDQTHVWADSFEGDSSQILQFENSLTKSVAHTLSLKLLAERRSEHVPANYAAHDAYLQGRYYLSQRSKAGFESALQNFGTAVAMDPQYARAYAELAVTYNLMGQYNWMDTHPAHNQGKAAAMQAIAADANLAEAHAALGFSKWFYDWDSAGAEEEVKKAIELEPSNVDAHHWYAMVLMTSGRLKEAEAQMRTALAMDPKALILRTNLGWVHYLERDYPKTIEEIQAVLKDNPNFLTAHYKLWWTYSVVGDQQHAWEEFKTVADSVMTPENVKRLEDVYQKEGYAGTLRAITSSTSSEGAAASANMVDNARCMSFAGDKGGALKFLERGLKNREGWMIFVESDPAFDSLRAEPEYARVIKAVHSAPRNVD
jgi:TolB-like protein/DNA-binding winged helix-turn-helix (wHTH) protein/Tfp pilus assembly protein PilF